MTRLHIRLAIYIIGGLLFLWFAQRATGQIGSWRDMPPSRFWGTATATVSYVPGSTIRQLCGQHTIACWYRGTVWMPETCGTGTRRETVDVGRTVQMDMSYCGSVRAHEFGHVNGWSALHER